MVRYTVRAGDTATGLAVRFHAWTDELLAVNRLDRGDTLYVGRRITIPVVRSAARSARHRHKAHQRTHRPHHRTHAAHGQRHAGDPSRARVRRIIVRAAHRHRLSANLALAVSWQEAGWQMHHVSSAHAVGAMQVLPSTGRWLSAMIGRRLHLREVHDNVTAGVVLLKWLRQEARLRFAIAGYYQGLGSVRAYGMRHDTKRYVARVIRLRRALDRGWNPARG